MNREDENCRHDGDGDCPNDYTHISTFGCNERSYKKCQQKPLLHTKDMSQDQP